MTEWGPWDHASPLVWPEDTVGGRQRIALRQFEQRPECSVEGTVKGRVEWQLTGTGPDYAVTLSAPSQGVFPYRLEVKTDGFSQQVRGALLAARWHVRVFPFVGDPVAEPNAWLTAWTEAKNATIEVERLDDAAVLRPPVVENDKAAEPQPSSRPAEARRLVTGFAATTNVPAPAGKWRIVAVTDGGLQVYVRGAPVIEAWGSERGTRRVSGEFTSTGAPVEIRVEHFGGRPMKPIRLRVLPG